MEKRVFYVVYFAQPFVQRCLDAIKFVCDPQEKNRAHITVRGPYKQQYHLLKATKLIQDSEISITGVDRFRSPVQATVFLACSSEKIRMAWRKPDYGYNPHITLYDGSNHSFGDALFSRLRQRNLQFTCMANGLSPIVSVRGQKTFELMEAYDDALVEELTGSRLSAEQVRQLDASTRLDLAVSLAAKLTTGKDHDFSAGLHYSFDTVGK